MNTLKRLQNDIKTLQLHLFNKIGFVPDNEDDCIAVIRHYKESYGVMV